MKNFKQPGQVMTVTAASAIVSGHLYQVGSLTGVATGSAESGDEYELSLNGAISIPNTDAIAAAQGDPVGYVEATHKVVAAGAGDFDVNLFKELLAGDADAVILLPLGGYSTGY